MNRMEFLKSLGLKGASLFAVYCAASGLSSCVNESMDPTTTNVAGSNLNSVLQVEYGGKLCCSEWNRNCSGKCYGICSSDAGLFP